jgi:predicted RNA-binding protein YlxR (DUF448 family)
MRLCVNKAKNRQFNETLSLCVTDEQRRDKLFMFNTKMKVLYSEVVYGVSCSEYFIFDFPSLSRKAKKEYVGEKEYVRLCDAVSTDTFWLFRDKYQTYLRFKDFYKRECIKIGNKSDKETFLNFTKRHPKFIVKALDKSKGRDNYLFDLTEHTDTAEDVFLKILALGNCIVEEFIVQSQEMAKFHPSSVNTIRFITFRKDDECLELYALVRLGCGNSHIDNVSAGGMMAMVDIPTGIVVTEGMRRYINRHEYFLVHPDTGERILGAKIPRWDELRALIQQIVDVVPEQRYVGWDFALTDNYGWVMIEGNTRANILSIQHTLHHGIRKQVEELFL